MALSHHEQTLKMPPIKFILNNNTALEIHSPFLDAKMTVENLQYFTIKSVRDSENVMLYKEVHGLVSGKLF